MLGMADELREENAAEASREGGEGWGKGGVVAGRTPTKRRELRPAERELRQVPSEARELEPADAAQ
jgi:hypothetical protein